MRAGRAEAQSSTRRGGGAWCFASGTIPLRHLLVFNRAFSRCAFQFSDCEAVCNVKTSGSAAQTSTEHGTYVHTAANTTTVSTPLLTDLCSQAHRSERHTRRGPLVARHLPPASRCMHRGVATVLDVRFYLAYRLLLLQLLLV